jgi:hypothetical protein
MTMRPPEQMPFTATVRNAPMQRFLREDAFTVGDDGTVHFDASAFSRDHEEDLSFFVLQES